MLILLGVVIFCLLKAAANNRDILIAIPTHTLSISHVELNLWEDDSSSCGARHNRQRIEQAATCADSLTFPVSPYFRLKPGLMEEWPYKGIALMRVSPDYRSHVDVTISMIGPVGRSVEAVSLSLTTTGSQAPIFSIHDSKPSSLMIWQAVET